jgi:hypothetical protein
MLPSFGEFATLTARVHDERALSLAAEWNSARFHPPNAGSCRCATHKVAQTTCDFHLRRIE